MECSDLTMSFRLKERVFDHPRKGTLKSKKEVTMKRTTSAFIFFLAVSLILGMSMHAVAAKNYPEKVITWIVPYAPGGGFDVYSRVIAKTLPKYLPNKVDVVVKNMPGGGSRRGSAVLYRSKPDGYTIGILNPSGLVTSDIVKKSTEYDLYKYTYLATCSQDVGGIYAAANSKFKTLEDLQKADRVKFASGGRGSTTWLWGMLAKGAMKIPVVEVSGYGGTSEYTTGVIRGDADAFTFASSSSVLSYFEAGELNPIIIFTLEPWELYPSAPTAKGTPYEELAALTQDRVVAAPPDLPADIAKTLETALINAMKDPELQEWAKKTKHPFFIVDGKKTLTNIKKADSILKKYEEYFK